MGAATVRLRRALRHRRRGGAEGPRPMGARMRSTAEIREGYLSFFEEKGHLRCPSYSLIPRVDDRSTLYTTAGMQPQMPYFLGREPLSALAKGWNLLLVAGIAAAIAPAPLPAAMPAIKAAMRIPNCR